jgi:hypothetical protein
LSTYGTSDARAFLEVGDRTLINEIIWSFIVQGILLPGLDDNNQTLPFVHLTDYGRQCVAEDRKKAPLLWGFLLHDQYTTIVRSKAAQIVRHRPKTTTL